MSWHLFHNPHIKAVCKTSKRGMQHILESNHQLFLALPGCNPGPIGTVGSQELMSLGQGLARAAKPSVPRNVGTASPRKLRLGTSQPCACATALVNGCVTQQVRSACNLWEQRHFLPVAQSTNANSRAKPCAWAQGMAVPCPRSPKSHSKEVMVSLNGHCTHQPVGG